MNELIKCFKEVPQLISLTDRRVDQGMPAKHVAKRQGARAGPRRRPSATTCNRSANSLVALGKLVLVLRIRGMFPYIRIPPQTPITTRAPPRYSTLFIAHIPRALKPNQYPKKVVALEVNSLFARAFA